MSKKLVVDALQFGMMARICAEANKELSEEQLLADTVPLTPAQERAGDEEEWCVVERWKLESAYPCTQRNNIYSTHRTAEEWIAYLTTPNEKGGEK